MSVAELHRIGVKLFAGGEGGDLLDLVPVFHRWIQSRALEDLLIDVAEYSHVRAGPGVVLVAHEGNYGLDETGGRRGLVYYAKRPLEGDLEQRLRRVCRKALAACRRLETDGVPAWLTFAGDAIQVFSNDRLAAANDERGRRLLEPAARALLDRLYAGGDYQLEHEPDPRERLTLTARAAQPVAVETLLARLAA